MSKIVVYIHGKGGNYKEYLHYVPLFKGVKVVGFDYHSTTPWDAKKEFLDYYNGIIKEYDKVIIVANSIGAYFTLNSLNGKQIEKAYFISPVVDMEKLILNMLKWVNATEEDLRLKGEIETPFNETLSYKYLTFTRENPIKWNIKTHILYGENDNLTDLETINSFCKNNNATLTVMGGGEHWFHTKEQTEFLDKWILNNL